MSRPGPTFPKGVVLAPHPLSEGWSEARLFWLPEPDSPFNQAQHELAAVVARMEEEGAVFGRMLHEPAAREALAAFAEKRKPDFSKV